MPSTHSTQSASALAGLTLDSLPIGISVVDGQGRILQTNAAAARLLGLAPSGDASRPRQSHEDRTFRSDGSLVEAAALPGYRAFHEQIRIEEPELGVLRPDGELVWLSITAAPLGPDRVVITYTEITHAHRSKAILAACNRLSERARGLALEDLPKATLDEERHALVEQAERNRLEESLAEREERYRTFFMHGPDGIVVLDPDTKRIVEFNDQACRQLGYTREEFAHLTMADLEALETAKETSGHIQEVMAKGYGDFETMQRSKQGELRNIHVTAQYLRTKGAFSYHCVWRDITETKRAQEQIEKRIIALTLPLEDGAVTFGDLFNFDEIQRIQDEFAAATGVAALITLPDGTPITRPSNFTHLCSEIIRKTERGRCNCFKSDAVLGRKHPEGFSVQKCLSGGLWDAGTSITIGGHHLANWLIGQVRDETQTDEQMRIYAQEIGADEASFLEAFHAVPAMSFERLEQIARALFSLASQLSTTAYQNVQQARFIAERKQAEEEKALLQAQLQQSQKMESLGTLAGGVAHDMNNVLGAILGLASAHMSSLPPGCDLHRSLATICKATERGGQMVKSLLSFARQSTAEFRILDLNIIIRDERSLLERTTLAKIRTHLDLEANLRPILGDASALTHAIMNLCVNAVDAMPEHGHLTLRTRNVDEDSVEVVVEDTGTGMAQEVLGKAMDPFFTTKEVGKGTGLGLSMVYSTVKAHRGQLLIESEPGQGTRVRIRLPACQHETPAQPDSEPAEAATSRRMLAVLLIDDDELIQHSMQMMLESLGHRVHMAGSGEEALVVLESGFEPDLVILDVNMPGLGGAGTLPRLRRMNPSVPVLLSTGRADQSALALASGHPDVTLISKPFRVTELQQQLEGIGLG
jgi:PAS domain S-box-containing protein